MDTPIPLLHVGDVALHKVRVGGGWVGGSGHNCSPSLVAEESFVSTGIHLTGSPSSATIRTARSHAMSPGGRDTCLPTFRLAI